MPASWAAFTASATTLRVPSESAAKMPPVCSQRTPCSLNSFFQFTSPGFMPAVAEWPRSYSVTDARFEWPTSVKFRPMRSTLPTPSYLRVTAWAMSMPTARAWLAMMRPIGDVFSPPTQPVRRPSRASA